MLFRNYLTNWQWVSCLKPISHGGHIYTMGISRCYNSGCSIFPLEEPVANPILTPLPPGWYHHRYLKVCSQRVPCCRPGWGQQFAFLVSSRCC